MKIHIKRTLQPLIMKDRIVFGLGNNGLIRTIPNNLKNINLIKYLNGELSKEKLDMSEIEVSSNIRKFKELGLLSTNDYSLESRYSRNYNFFEWVDKSSNTDPSLYQKKLNNSYVEIFGVGGVGAGIAEQLARAGVGRLKLIDFDVVEESNITRQSTYTEKDLGTKKIFSCRRYLKSINRNIKVDVVDQKITNMFDVKNCVDQNVDLIINCMDKPDDIDKWFDEFSNSINRPVIFSSYASTVANIFVKVPGVTMNYTDFLGKEKITSDCIIENEFSTAVIAPVTYMAAAMSSYNAIMLLTNLRVPTTAIQIDFDNWNVLKIDTKINSKNK